MKKLFLVTMAALLLLWGPMAFGQGLRTGDQVIYGNKTFEHNMTIEGSFTVEGPSIGLNSIGEVVWVGSTWGKDGAGWGKTWDKPLATIDFAIPYCAADMGCTIYVLPWHAETVTSAITVDVAGINIIGLTNGRNMPVITPNGAIDAMTITSADVTIANLYFDEPGTDVQTADINIGAARVSVFNTIHIGSQAGSTEVKVDIITITSAGHDFLLDGIRIHNKTTEMTGGGIAIEGAAERGEIRNVQILDSIGFANGAVYDEATALQLYIHDNVFQCAKSNTVCMEFGNNSTGVFAHNFIAARYASAIATGMTLGSAMDYNDNYIINEAVLSGLLKPDVDAE